MNQIQSAVLQINQRTATVLPIATLLPTSEPETPTAQEIDIEQNLTQVVVVQARPQLTRPRFTRPRCWSFCTCKFILFWLWFVSVPTIFYTCTILYIPEPRRVCPSACYKELCTVTDLVPDQGKNFTCTCVDGGFHCKNTVWKDGKDGNSKIVAIAGSSPLMFVTWTFGMYIIL